MTSVELPQSIPFQPVRMSVHRYHELTAVGAFNEHDSVELLDGVVVEKMSKNPPHRLATRKCDLLLSELVPRGWHVQNQEPITLQNSEPEPDVAVIRGQMSDYSNRHPGVNEIELVVEVADTTLVTDRYKGTIYAAAGIPTYWLINLVDQCIEVMSIPQVIEGQSSYAACDVLGIGAWLDLRLAGQAIGKIEVARLLL